MFVAEMLLGFVTLLLALHYYFTRTFHYWKRKKVNGPKPTILFGNLGDSTLRRVPTAVDTKRIYDDFPDEPFVGLYRMTTPSLLIRDLDLIKNVMIKDFDSFDDRGVRYGTGLALNLFHADGATWRALRTRFTPLFTSGKLRNMLSLVDDCGDKFLAHVERVAAEDPERPVHKLVQLYTIATIAACAFGLDVDPTDGSSAPILNKLDEIDRLMFTKNIFQEVDTMYPGLFESLNMSIFPKTITSFFEGLVSRILEERSGAPSGRNDFMDLLLQLRSEGNVPGSRRSGDSEGFSLEVTDEIMAAQAFIFYAGGYETGATTMAFMLYELARHPRVQDRLLAEVDEALAQAGGAITPDTLGRLPYMDQVFEETLRMYPVIDPLQRAVTRDDYTIPGTDVVLEKGTMVLVSVMGIHYDERLYPRPTEFIPERFDPKVAGERHSCSFLPFGVGPRNCIGMRFAKVQSRVCMLKLLSRFRVEPAANEEPMTYDNSRVFITPNENYKLKFVSREKINK